MTLDIDWFVETKFHLNLDVSKENHKNRIHNLFSYCEFILSVGDKFLDIDELRSYFEPHCFFNQK